MSTRLKHDHMLEEIHKDGNIILGKVYVVPNDIAFDLPFEGI